MMGGPIKAASALFEWIWTVVWQLLAVSVGGDWIPVRDIGMAPSDSIWTRAPAGNQTAAHGPPPPGGVAVAAEGGEGGGSADTWLATASKPIATPWASEEERSVVTATYHVAIPISLFAKKRFYASPKVKRRRLA